MESSIIKKASIKNQTSNYDYPFPLRYRYPQTEMSNNSAKYQETIGRLDQGDTEYSKMWLLQ